MIKEEFGRGDQRGFKSCRFDGGPDSG